MYRVILSLLFVAGLTAAPLEFAVSRKRLLRDEPGQLTVAASGVHYESSDGKTSIEIPLEDIRRADLSDPKAVSFQTYDRKFLDRRVYTFGLASKDHREELARFLVDNLKRPVIAGYALQAEVAFRILAYHRRGLSGSHGTVEIAADGIRFVSGRAVDSRTWLYRDIESIGSAGPFHFRITTDAETYSFDLKERLATEAYEFAWQRVYASVPSVRNRTSP
jgi:hypothetical protein